MQNKEETKKDMEGGDIELAEGGDIQQNKMNYADELSGNFPKKTVDDGGSPNSMMKKCFIGITLLGISILIPVIIALATSSDSGAQT